MLSAVLRRAFVFELVGRRQFAHDLGRIARDERIRRHVADDDRACRDDGVFPDGDAADDRNAPADPDVVFNCDRKRVFLAGDTILHVERMTGGVDADVRRDPHIVADAHVIAVKNDEVVVCEKVFTDFDADMQEDIESIQALKDIINNPNIPENERHAAKDKLAILEKEVMQRQLSVQTDGDVKLINQNSRLIITHQGANTSVSEVFYDLATLSTGNARTFDFSFYKGKIYDEANGWALTDTTAPKVEVFVGGATVLTIEENGMLMAGGKALGQCKASGWNNISVVLERENENSPYLLTVYLAGEIVLFRGEMTQPDALSRVGIRSTGENKDQFRLDNLALSLGNIPTSVVYMHPITYVVGDGQMALNTEEGYHIIGKRKETFPTVGIEGAIFGGWYYDKEFTSKANFVRASYTQPIVLYAKYDYRVTFNLNKEGQVNPPDIISCGQITMPIVNGVS